MAQIIHRAESRGHADYGWLNTYHSFSFGDYYNPNRMNFGALRVLNDDTIDGGTGFGTHPHKNMEIITIPLTGALAHKDSMGNSSVIKQGEVQIMSAGTGIHHSEYNHKKEQKGYFLQIWIIPNKENVTPRYGQLSLKIDEQLNKFQQIVSPDPTDEGLWIHQQAWLHLGTFEERTQITHKLKKRDDGIYLFMISGTIEINNQTLTPRDAIGIIGADAITFQPKTRAKVLTIEIPMI